jgi:ankyrin repeat protein
MYFYKSKGMNLKTRDNRMSTPIHWAIYSKSEVSMAYLLAWDQSLCNDKDSEGYTPLHLAVKSVE